MRGPLLILGATGAIGAHAVRACIAAGWSVRALVRPTSDTSDLAGLATDVVEGDIHRPVSLDRAFAGCTGFVHAAGFYPSRSMSRAQAVNAGLASVEPVFEAAREAGVGRGVYVSSLTTIPRPREDRGRVSRRGRGTPTAGAALATERGPVVAGGTGPYHAAKAAMERAALESVAGGLPLVIVNPTLCLGEHDRKPTSGRIVVEVARGRVPVYVDGPVNVVYTGDVGLGIARALELGRPGERYVLGGTNTSFGWLLRQIAFETGARPPLLPIPLSLARAGAKLADTVERIRGRPAMTEMAVDIAAASQHFDTSKAAHELGLTSPTPAVETVRRTVSWFAQVGLIPGAKTAR